jgi:hypothetical protein
MVNGVSNDGFSVYDRRCLVTYCLAHYHFFTPDSTKVGDHVFEFLNCAWHWLEWTCPLLMLKASSCKIIKILIAITHDIHEVVPLIWSVCCLWAPKYWIQPKSYMIRTSNWQEIIIMPYIRNQNFNSLSKKWNYIPRKLFFSCLSFLTAT